MAPAPSSSTLQVSNFSPAELSYLHTSLSYPRNPIRPDGRSATQFRPLAAETNIVPNAYGSARIGFADGTQAIVGVKAEVEKTVFVSTLEQNATQEHEAEEEEEESNRTKIKVSGSGSWVEMSIEIPGLRDDDPLPVFLAEMMREGLIQSGSGSGGLKERLVINQGWHWRVYVDVSVLPSSRKGQQSNVRLGTTSFSTTIIPSPTAISNDTSRTTIYQTPAPHIER